MWCTSSANGPLWACRARAGAHGPRSLPNGLLGHASRCQQELEAAQRQGEGKGGTATGRAYNRPYDIVTCVQVPCPARDESGLALASGRAQFPHPGLILKKSVRPAVGDDSNNNDNTNDIAIDIDFCVIIMIILTIKDKT